MKKIILISLLILVLVGGGVALFGYKWIMSDNVVDSPSEVHEIYINSGWNYDSLATALYPILEDFSSFDAVAEKMNLPNKVIPGKYIIKDFWGNRKLIGHLRSGSSVDVNVVLNSSLKGNAILGRIAEPMAVDSAQLSEKIKEVDFLKSLGYNGENWPALFRANTYRFNWATSPEDVFKRFKQEDDKFWTGKRNTKASKLGLSRIEVVILASIVDAETMMDSELNRIAGVYLNRLQKDWPLGADPTIRFLIGEEGRQRVLNKDLKIESPYNTYLNLGLPPGPVLLPSNKAVDAVLDAESHDYMFFCAKADFSGYHAFAKSIREHNRNAAAYRRELNRRNIMK